MSRNRKTDVSIEEKIEIFEKFRETNEPLNGQTMYNGYPVGKWSIQLRSQIIKRGRNLPKEQLDKLAELGILERVIESTIDEKIEALVEWCQKYPNIIKFKSKFIPEEMLKEYSHSEEEYKKLLAEYEKMQKYYEYISARKRKGKLTPEQEQKCKEGNIKNIFGYSSKIEDLAKKYRINEAKISYIIEKYGSMDEFLNKYRNGELDGSDTFFLMANLKRAIDVDLKEKIGYEFMMVGRSLDKRNNFKGKSIVYSSNSINDVLTQILPREKDIIERRFGISGKSKETLHEIAEDSKVSDMRIWQIEANALRKFAREQVARQYIIPNHGHPELNEEYEKLMDIIFNSNFIFYPDKKYEKEPIDINIGELAKCVRTLRKIQAETVVPAVDEKRENLRDLLSISRGQANLLDEVSSLEKEYEKQLKGKEPERVGENIGE